MQGSLPSYIHFLTRNLFFSSTTQSMKRFLSSLSLFMLMMMPVSSHDMMVQAQHMRSTFTSQNFHIQKNITPRNGSNVEGIVDLMQLPRNNGTHITVIGFHLNPNQQYVSLYYSNHTCALEPYSRDDVIGGIYIANKGGVGVTRANQHDNLDDINSVSIRDASTFQLLACADIHP